MTSVRRFFASLSQLGLRDFELIDAFVYYLTIEIGRDFVTVADLRTCFEQCDLRVSPSIGPSLSKGLNSRPVKYVRRGKGYRLQAGYADLVRARLGHEEAVAQTTSSLRQLEGKLAPGAKRDFLHETIDCFGVHAYRASTVMCWNLALHHLQDHVFLHHLAALNPILATNQDRTVRTKSVTKRDDFSDIPEGKFLEFCRTAKVITASLYNKLKTRLDERNAAAHPSGIKVTSTVAQAYIDELVENVLLKFSA